MNYEKLTVNELFNEYEHLGIQKMKLIQKMNRMKHSKQLFMDDGTISFPQAESDLKSIKETIRNKFYSGKSKHEGKISFKEIMENSDEWAKYLIQLVEARWTLDVAKSEYKYLKSKLDSVLEKMNHIRGLIRKLNRSTTS